jgi:antitoxin CptB
MATQLETRRKRAIWRAAHRGTKEMDWLLGRFAEACVPAMTEAGLTRFERFLALPDPELQTWLMAPVPPRGLEFEGIVAEVRAFHGLGVPPAAH